jgi:hypothetical protein
MPTVRLVSGLSVTRAWASGRRRGALIFCLSGNVITTPQDFRDEISWELMVLGVALPVAAISGSARTLDLRFNETRTVSFVDSFSDYATIRLRLELLPLLFGAGWKVLDISVEFALASAGHSPARAGRWSIDEKTREIVNVGQIPMLSASPDIWPALRTLYIRTKEARHALVHRRVRVDANTRELTCFDTQRRPLISLSVAEQTAFCGVCQRLATAVIDGFISPRAESDLRNQLLILQRLHGNTVYVPPQYHVPSRVVDNFPADGRIDVLALKARVREVFPTDYYIDLELHVSDGRILNGELEQAPDELVSVDLGNFPFWLRFA